TPANPTPTPGLALGTRVEHPVPQPVSPETAHHHLTRSSHPSRDAKTHRNNPTTRPGDHRRAHHHAHRNQGTQSNSTPHRQQIGGSGLRSRRRLRRSFRLWSTSL